MMTTEDWDKILTALTERLAEPRPALPSVRWISEPRLRNLLVTVRNRLDISGKKQLTGKRLLDNLCQSGLAHELLIPDVPHGQKPLRIYRLGMGTVERITPFELLQAVKPNEVICYFSALEFHDLTTQIAPHHHIARLEAVTKSAATRIASGSIPVLPAQGELNGGATEEGAMLRCNLGTLLFRHEGVPYYWTRRDQALVPGVQWVYLSSETMVHVMTLEQTLLDTLHRPWSCGGPAVVYEAWDRGASRLDAERLAEYLRTVDRPAVCRRVGHMLERCEYQIDSPGLKEILRKTREGACGEPVLPLLPGVPGNTIDPRWNLEIPG